MRGFEQILLAVSMMQCMKQALNLAQCLSKAERKGKG